MSKWTSTDFSDMSEFENMCMDLPTAESRLICVDGKNEFEPKFRAIVNLDSNEVAQIATDKYAIIQHKEFFSGLALNLHDAGLDDIKGKVLMRDGGNSVVVKMRFNKFMLEEPNYGKNIYLGAVFKNSFNSKQAATGSLSMLRLVCTNGLTIEKLIPMCDFSRNHNCIDPKLLIEEVALRRAFFVGGLIKSGEQFLEIMEKAIKAEVIFRNPQQLFDSMLEIFKADKHAEAIATELMKSAYKDADGKIYTDHWELYNACTHYTSHEEKLSQDIIMKLENVAEEKILDTRKEIPLPLPIPKSR